MSDSSTFERGEVLMDKPTYVAYTILEFVSYMCKRHIMINYNLILESRIYNVLISIRILLF